VSEIRFLRTSGRFEVGVGVEVAYLAYEFDGSDGISLLHTQVPPAHRGRGIATDLARMAFEYAAGNHLRVEVICPVAYHFLTKYPDYKYLVRVPAGFDGNSLNESGSPNKAQETTESSTITSGRRTQ